MAGVKDGCLIAEPGQEIALRSRRLALSLGTIVIAIKLGGIIPRGELQASNDLKMDRTVIGVYVASVLFSAGAMPDQGRPG
jgi:hypothetical protein